MSSRRTVSENALQPAATDAAPSYQPYGTNYQNQATPRLNNNRSWLGTTDLSNAVGNGAESRAREWMKLEAGDELDPGPGPAGVPVKQTNLDFKEVFAEHESTQTYADLYNVQGTIYKYSKFILYHILSISLGIPLSIIYGCINALVLFILVWIVGPIIKLFLLSIWTIGPFASGSVLVVLSPIMDACGRSLRQIRVRVQMEGRERSEMAENRQPPV